MIKPLFQKPKPLEKLYFWKSELTPCKCHAWNIMFNLVSYSSEYFIYYFSCLTDNFQTNVLVFSNITFNYVHLYLILYGSIYKAMGKKINEVPCWYLWSHTSSSSASSHASEKSWGKNSMCSVAKSNSLCVKWLLWKKKKTDTRNLPCQNTKTLALT